MGADGLGQVLEHVPILEPQCHRGGQDALDESAASGGLRSTGCSVSGGGSPALALLLLALRRTRTVH
jgi:hypothetical protein